MRARDGLDPFTVPAVPRGLLSSFVLAFQLTAVTFLTN
jgi:hypothetical protein